MKSGVFNKSFIGGIHPLRKKDRPFGSIEKLPFPDEIFVSLSRHIGAPAVSVVQKGDIVKRGQLIAKAQGTVSANVHSSVNGEVAGFIMMNTSTGKIVKHVNIKKTGDECEKLGPMKELTPSSIRERIRAAGIIGKGGAGFPTDVKLNPSNPIDVLIVNGAECEPYLTCDSALMCEHAGEILAGAKLMQTACGAKEVLVCIEDDKPQSIEAMRKAGAQVKALKTRYPQGSERQLIFSAIGKIVPVGKFPMDTGVIVQNVATAFAVYRAVEHNEPLVDRVMTVSGGGIKNPKNLIVPIGTQLKYVADYCGGISEDTVKIITGGPMMGFALESLEITMGKKTSGLLALTKEEASAKNPTPCINCGRCAKVCPMILMPMYIDMYTLAGKFELAKKYGALSCIECGCCSWVCPAKRAIVQSARMAKVKLRS